MAKEEENGGIAIQGNWFPYSVIGKKVHSPNSKEPSVIDPCEVEKNVLSKVI